MGRKYEGVISKSKTSIQINFTYQGKRCRETVKLKPTPANLKKAFVHRGGILAAIAVGQFDYAKTFPDSKNVALFAHQAGDVITFNYALDKWLKEKKHLVKSSTFISYRKAVNQLSAVFGDLWLSDLRRQHVKDWAIEKLEINKSQGLNFSNSTLNRLLVPLRGVMANAMDNEEIETNPLHNWDFRLPDTAKILDAIEPFSSKEQAAILSVLEGHNKNLIQFAFWSGLRSSELIALEWSHIDWPNLKIKVVQAQTRGALAPESTKSKAGRREVKLLQPAIDALQAQKPLSMLHPSNRVFLNPKTGKPWTCDQAIRKGMWTHALKRAGVTYRYPYQTRHTYASMMVAAGESLPWIASQLGHTSIKMILNNYARYMPDANADAGVKAHAMFAATR